MIEATTDIMFDLIIKDPRLSHFFSFTGTSKHAHRLAAFLTYLTGGHDEWVGPSIDHAHAGRFISEEHFELFVLYFKQAMVVNKIPDVNSIHDRFVEALMMTKNLIVFQEEQGLSFFQQITYQGRFDKIMITFADLLSRDPLFIDFFKQNIMIK